MLNITQIPAPRVEFIDPRSGFMSREWYRFFINLFQLTGNGSNTTSLSDLQVGPPTQETFVELDNKLNSFCISPNPETSELQAQIENVQQELETQIVNFDLSEIEKQIEGLSLAPPSVGPIGYTGTITTASLVGKTITIKDGLITGFA